MKRFLLLLALAATASTASALIYVSGSVGRFLDEKATYYSGRFGYELADTAVLSHNAELEYLTWDKKEALLGPMSARGDVMAAMVNYRIVGALLPILRMSAGAGAGAAKLELRSHGTGVPTITDDDTRFAWHVFATVNYTIVPRVDLTVGARYFKFDPEIFGRKDLVGADTGIEAGLNFRF